MRKKYKSLIFVLGQDLLNAILDGVFVRLDESVRPAHQHRQRFQKVSQLGLQSLTLFFSLHQIFCEREEINEEEKKKKKKEISFRVVYNLISFALQQLHAISQIETFIF